MKTTVLLAIIVAMQLNIGHAQEIPLDERFTLDGCYAAAKFQKAKVAAMMAAAEQVRREAVATAERVRRETLAAQAHEDRKARAAYLISYIISVGNWIDDHTEPSHGEKVARSWAMIMEAQDELHNIYATELRLSQDPTTLATLRENIAKLTVGRQYAKNQLARYGRDFPKSW